MKKDCWYTTKKPLVSCINMDTRVESYERLYSSMSAQEQEVWYNNTLREIKRLKDSEVC